MYNHKKNRKAMKGIIRLLLLVVTFATFSLTASAQSSQNGRQNRLTREQLAEAQAKHIAKELAFDEATSKRFITTYCQYQKEVWALGPRPKAQQGQSIDEQAGQKLKYRFDHSQKLLDLRKKYYATYCEFLTQVQIERVYKLERQMMQRFAKRAKGAGGNQRKGRISQQ